MDRLGPNLRDRFLREYAESLVQELDNYLDAKEIVHRAQVKAGSWSEVEIEILKEESQEVKDLLIRMPREWHPANVTTIRCVIPNKIIVTKPSSTHKDMLAWSNVQCWEDASYIISTILSASML